MCMFSTPFFHHLTHTTPTSLELDVGISSPTDLRTEPHAHANSSSQVSNLPFTYANYPPTHLHTQFCSFGPRTPLTLHTITRAQVAVKRSHNALEMAVVVAPAQVVGSVRRVLDLGAHCHTTPIPSPGNPNKRI